LDLHLQLNSLAVHISNVNSSLMVKQDNILISYGINANIGFLFLLVGNERLYDELLQLS